MSRRQKASSLTKQLHRETIFAKKDAVICSIE
jgi:hypothetical protein